VKLGIKRYVDEFVRRDKIKPEEAMELKERLELLVAKDGQDCFTQLLLEQILQLDRLNGILERGIVTYQGGDAEDVEEEETEEE